MTVAGDRESDIYEIYAERQRRARAGAPCAHVLVRAGRDRALLGEDEAEDEAFELNPPAGQEPVEWILLTSLPAETFAQARRIIRAYTLRWKIEEFHRILKSGCRVERIWPRWLTWSAKRAATWDGRKILPPVPNAFGAAWENWRVTWTWAGRSARFERGMPSTAPSAGSNGFQGSGTTRPGQSPATRAAPATRSGLPVTRPADERTPPS